MVVLPTDDQRRDELLWKFKHNRLLFHTTLFSHRHKDESADFHVDMCNLLYSPDPLVAMLAFRGAAKSTWGEEYILGRALFREGMFKLIIGPKWESACERLAPIRHELETNDMLIELFGDQRSSPWSSDELVLANGVKIKAIGVGQSMRGTKHNDERPDEAFVDDLEDEESVRTEESRKRTERWFNGVLRPALHPTNGRIRFIGTAIHPKSLIVKKCSDPEWKSRVFPIINIDTVTGEEKSAWPSRFPIDWIKKLRQDYLNSGNLIEFNQEYMCLAEDISGKPFQESMIKVEPAPAVHMPMYAMADPARTVGQRSARSGYAVWSWVGPKMYVHLAEGHFHRPDEQVAFIRQINTRFNPIYIGAEKDGLEEFLMQPLRAEMLARGNMPILPEAAPREVSKDPFILGLQPFYISGNVVHVQDFPDLNLELMQFPTGRKDVLNALAYAPRLRAGKLVYEDFTIKHIAQVLEPHRALPRFLCVSARGAMTTGVLVQYVDGILKVYYAWVYNEPPQECFGRMLREAILINGAVKVVAPQEQMDQYTNHGLPAACLRERITLEGTGWAAKSEGSLRSWLQKQVRGDVAFMVSKDARWVVNALSGGYARKLNKHGHLNDLPEDNQYRVVMEGLEAFVSWFDLHYGLNSDKVEGARYKYTDSGTPYISLRP